MNLPELEWQVAYGRIAWAVVLPAAGLALARRWTPVSRGAIACALLAAAALVALPGAASPVYWLGLAFQWPSAMCVGLCLIALRAQWQGRSSAVVLPPALAAVAAIAGALLYLDASGWIAVGLYFSGFSGQGGSAIALLLGLPCVVAFARSEWRPQATAVLGALLAFMVLRLPTGNLWDALLDPFVWVWSLVVLARGGWGFVAAFAQEERR